MPPIIPEETPEEAFFVTPQKQPPPGTADTSMPTPPTRSAHDCDTKIFCCNGLYPLIPPRGPHEHAIYHFAYYMVNVVNPPANRAYLPAAHSMLLEQADYVIRFERWTNGEKDDVRHFIPHPKLSSAFIELHTSTLETSSSTEKWIANWRYIKFRCDSHEGPWFVCYVLERREAVRMVEMSGEREKRKLEVDDVLDGDWSSEEDEVLDTPTHKIKRRKL